MHKRALLTLTALFSTICSASCGGAQQPSPAGPPAALPPTRAPAVATLSPTPPPSPTATFAPTATPSPTPEEIPAQPTVTPEGSPTTIVSTAAPSPMEADTPIGTLSVGMIGQEVTISGRVVETASFSAGFKFALDDGTGQVVLLTWHSVYGDCWDAADLNLGAMVRATGELDAYEGELQVAPAWGSDVQVLEPAGLPGEPRQIGTLSGADENNRVLVEGSVIRTAGSESWVKVFVGDDSGEIGVFVWRSVLDHIGDNTALGTPGSRVRVSGVVTVYRSNLELVPTLPNDVLVLEIGPES